MSLLNPRGASGKARRRRRVRLVRMPGLVFQFFAAGIAAMLLLDSPAAAVAAPVPAPEPRPSGGVSGCRTPAEPEMAGFLSGKACPPEDFPYRPRPVTAGGVRRMTDPFGACSSLGVPARGETYDFRTACRTHDYGYDLLRHLHAGGGRRRAVDLLFYDDMRRECGRRPQEDRASCLRVATLAYRAVVASSRMLGYAVPLGSVTG